MKNFYKKMLLIIMFTALMVFNSFAATNVNSTKRVVCIVYDDSRSMYRNNQDYVYANYALQNIVGFMNEKDELYIVQMSNKFESRKIDLSSEDAKKQNILNIEKWDERVLETPFDAVETAVDRLKSTKDLYGKSEDYEYWLLVLTDGEFDGLPTNANEYFDSVNDYMSDVKYESIWVFIGNDTKEYLKNTLLDLNNANVLQTDNKEGITSSLFEAVEKIYGRSSIKGNAVNANGNIATINYNYPISKLIVYEQDQNVNLTQIVDSSGNTYIPKQMYTANKSNQSQKLQLSSNIIEFSKDGSYLPAGNIEMTFDDSIDISQNKFQVIVEPAIALELYAIDAEGKEEENDNGYVNGDLVNFEMKVVNSYDGQVINLNNDASKIKAEFICDGEKRDVTYNGETNSFRFDSNVRVGNNAFSGNVELLGYFKIKSNVKNIYVPQAPRDIVPVINKNNIKVTKNINKDFEKVDTIEYKLQNLLNKENGTMKFSDIPKGIQLKVNGVTIKKDQVNLTLNEVNNIEIYSNKEYVSTDSQNIYIDLNFNNENIKIKDKGLTFSIEPEERTLTLKVEKLFDDAKDFDAGKAYNRNIYKITPQINGANISGEELKQSKIAFENHGDQIKWKYKIDVDNNENIVYISVNRPINMFTDKNINTNLVFTTPFGDTKTTDFVFVINSNILMAVLSILIPLVILIYVIGIIKKPRFEKKNHKIIIMKNDTEEFNGSIFVNGGLNALIPFKAETGSAPDLQLKATNSEKRIIVLRKSLTEDMSYDGDDVPLSRDLNMYEENELIKKENRNRITYIYHDVRNDIEDEENARTRRGGRRRR